MMRWVFVIIMALCTMASDRGWAVPLTIDLANKTIDITVGFSGAHVSLFGIKEQQGKIAIIIEGPYKTVLVRKKESVFGAWLNRRTITFVNVPSFYRYALNFDEAEMGNYPFLERFPIGLSRVPLEEEKDITKWQTLKPFKEAFLRNMISKFLYGHKAGQVEMINENFFRYDLYFPSNVPVGDYVITTILFNEDEVLSRDTTTLKVAQVGNNAVVNSFAHNQSLAYGLLCVILALLAGWGINTLRKQN